MCRNRSPWSVQEWIPARRIIPGQSDLFLYILGSRLLNPGQFHFNLGHFRLNSVQFRLNPGQSMIDRCFGGKMKRRLSFENRNLEWTKFGRLSRIIAALYRIGPDSSSYSLLVNIVRASSSDSIAPVVITNDINQTTPHLTGSVIICDYQSFRVRQLPARQNKKISKTIGERFLIQLNH